MSVKCPVCKNNLLPAKDGGGFCKLCGEFFSKEHLSHKDFPRGKKLVYLIPKLPTVLAIILDEYIREPDNYKALHSICSAIEITAKFLTIIVLADILRQKGCFPDKLLKDLSEKFARPTLGTWVNLLKAARKALPNDDKQQKICLIPQLPEYVNRFSQALGSGNEDPLKKLLPMRNLLAHAGRFSDEMTDNMLEAHAQQFERLMLELDFLSQDADVMLVASPAKEPARILHGVSATGQIFDRSCLPKGFQQAEPDRMLLVAPQGVLDLFPLHAFGQVVINDRHEEENASQLYFRKTATAGADYTVHGTRASFSRGPASWEHKFAELFRLEEWRSRFQIKGALAKYSFTRNMDELLELFIGRDKQAEDTAALINELPEGILWIGGNPGIGKSAFIAKLVRNFQETDADSVLCSGCIRNNMPFPASHNHHPEYHKADHHQKCQRKPLLPILLSTCRQNAGSLPN